jgi:transposase
VELTRGMLGLFFLLPYSPELNPDEFVWNDVKNNGVGRKMIANELVYNLLFAICYLLF